MLWFNASHERDVVPLLDPLASARQRVACRRSRKSGNNSGVDDDGDDGDEADAPLFDEAWFMEVNPGRPSRFTPPTVQEILSPHGVLPVAVTRGGVGHEPPPDDEVLQSREKEEEEKERDGGAEAKAGAWQRTLQQVTFFVVVSRETTDVTLIVTAKSPGGSCV